MNRNESNLLLKFTIKRSPETFSPLDMSTWEKNKIRPVASSDQQPAVMDNHCADEECVHGSKTCERASFIFMPSESSQLPRQKIHLRRVHALREQLA